MAEAALSEPMRLLQQRLPVTPTDYVVPERPDAPTGEPTQQDFSVGAWNVQSIRNLKRWNERVRPLVEGNHFNIFALIETQLLEKHHTGAELDLPGYSYVRKDRRFAKKQKGSIKKLHTTEMPAELNSEPGGGILIYIHDSVKYKVKSKGEYAESNVEFLHIEITNPVQLHLVALYCPNKKFVGDLISLMSYFMDPLGTDRNIMFIGDTNINRYGKVVDDRRGNTFFDVLTVEYGVEQFIKQKTHSCACIDHIFTNLSVRDSGVMDQPIGHTAIYCTLDRTLPDQPLLAVPAVRETTNYTNEHVQFVQPFVKKLAGLLTGNECILAIFFKFSKHLNISDWMRWQVRGVKKRYMKDEVAFYTTVANQHQISKCIRNLQRAAVLCIDQTLTQSAKKQCTIFTSEHQSPTFHDLQKEMWYKDWDFVWQPRHVEFLGHVLEPSLTRVLPMYPDGSTFWSTSLDEPQAIPEAVKRQESTYRYVARACELIVRL